MNRHISKSTRIFASLLLLLYLGFCGCDPAQSKEVPSSFNLDNFDRVVEYSLSNYLDPELVQARRSYIGAAEEALKSLPAGLLLLPENFYTNMSKLVAADRQIPGKVLKIAEKDPYIILIPDYKEIDKRRKAVEAREKVRRKGMTAAQKNQETEKLRDQIKQEQKSLEDEWNNIKFSRDDFKRVIGWIEANIENYKELPATFEGENPYADNPFGMHYVYFAAANGFLQNMDPHSAVIDTTSWDKMRKESEDSSFEGIGALLRGGGSSDVIVETPLPGSPALKAGLHAGDIIRKVDGKSIESLSLSDVVKRIRGKTDTFVELGVERKSEIELVMIRIKRAKIEQKAVSSNLLVELPYKDFMSMKVGIIKVSSFLFEKSLPSELIRREYYQLLDKSQGKLDGLILDLRGNPGGDLEEAINVGALFLPKDSVVVEIRSKNDRARRKSRENPLVQNSKDVPIIVLINANSASASEIVASALQDYDAALILGERSFGKASVQTLRQIDSVLVKLTTARYYAPKGYTVQVYGVEPDIKVSDEVDGGFPIRYREEDMWKHLPELKQKPDNSKRDAWVNQLKQSAQADLAAAETYLHGHEKDAIKPDSMLIRALPYLKAMQSNPAP
ncbi:MAG: S41 family peptidase [Leptonema sp. (in: Bacteria)]|nr:S41 family peptidase [Leptonema sp. (in: bacteria)]